MSSPKDIYWMASPLAIDQRNDLVDKEIKVLKPVNRYINPKNEIHVFRKIEHWTLQIDDKCYELSPDTKKKLNVIKKLTDMIKPHWVDAGRWREMREIREIEPEKRKIGQTSKTHDEIWAEVDYIWANFNHDWYGFFTQNCQNFAHTLFERVAIKTPDAGKGLWDRIPDPVGYRLAEGSQLALASKIAHGTKAAYLGAAAKAGPAGTMGATSGGTASGGAAVAGGTGTATTAGTTASGTAAAGSTTASGSAAAGSTTVSGSAAASGSGAAAAGGTTAGSTTAGGGAVTSGHVGVGAKVAGLMHGGHAAAIGSGMAKGAAAAALAHPVTGLALTGTLAYVAIRGKRSKRWNKKHKKVEEMDVFDLLTEEDEAFELAENPDQEEQEELMAELDDSDQEIDHELAEELKLGLVTTDPGTVPEEHEVVPASQNASRAQTTL